MTQQQIEQLGKDVYAICKVLYLGADKSPVSIQEFAAMRAQIAAALITRGGMQEVSQSLDEVANNILAFANKVEGKNF